MSDASPTQLRPLVDDLQRIFTDRLLAVVAYGVRSTRRAPSLALVRDMTLDDLGACAARAASWHRAGYATPLVLTRREFERSLDAFPIEYGEILATHQTVLGTDPFEGLSIAPDDLRRAIEVQVKSHLLHLREDFLEGGGRLAHVAALVRESAPAFAALLRHLARLDAAAIATTGDLIAYAGTRIRLDGRVVGDLLALADPEGMTSVDPGRIFPGYLATVEKLADFVDQWRER